jgi:hypothetical protein
MLSHIFSYCFAQDTQVASLKNSIKGFMKLSILCKNFLMPEAIGNLCKHYEQSVKDKNLFDLGKSMDDTTYQRLRVPALLLVYAGVNANAMLGNGSYLLTQAISFDDEQMVEALLKHDVDTNIAESACPFFFLIKDINIARLCINYGLNVHKVPRILPINVLWEVIRPSYPAELLELYVQSGVNPQQLHPLDNSCLLHGLANTDYVQNTEVFLRKANFLLNVLPLSMVNALDRSGQTAMDVAYASLESSSTSDPFKQLIVSLSIYGGVRVKEFTQKTIVKQIDQ